MGSQSVASTMAALLIGDVDKVYESQKGLKKDDVQKFREWVQLQPHLPNLTDMQLIHFLHSNKFSNEAAKQCIDLFLTVRTHCPEFFAKRDPFQIDTTTLMYGPFPKKTPEGYKIFYAKLMDNDADKFSFALLVKMFDMITMMELNREGPAEGVIYIHDIANLTFSHLTKINILHLKKFFYYLQECMPIRIEGLHFINIGNFMNKILALITPFMKKELIQVLHSHPTMESMYKFIPQDYFPSDFGGDPSYSIKSLQDKATQDMKSHSAFYIEEEKQKVDESKRPGKPKDPGEIFGVEGTFKKLDID